MKPFFVRVLATGLAGMGLFCAASRICAADSAATPATQPADDATPQYAPDPEAMLQRLRARLDSLKLSDEQQQKIDDAFAKARQSLELSEQELQNATTEQRAQHLRDIYQKLREDIRSALTPAQQEQFRKEMAAAPAQMLNRLRDALSKLQLTDDQKQKVHDLLEEMRGKVQQASTGAKAAGEDAGEKLRAATDDLRQKLGDILTDEQRLRLRKLMEAPAAPTTQPE
jgi:Spy/CpxP family protein refolding chaperone